MRLGAFRFDWIAVDIVTAAEDVTACRAVNAGDASQCGRLARSVWTDESDDLAWRNIERQTGAPVTPDVALEGVATGKRESILRVLLGPRRVDLATLEREAPQRISCKSATAATIGAKARRALDAREGLGLDLAGQMMID